MEEKKTRETKQKALITDALRKNHGRHLSVEEIDEILRAGGHDVGVATIYRNLKRFESEGVVTKVQNVDGGCVYQYSAGAHEDHSHHHLICTECKKIEDFDVDLLDNIERMISDKTGFSISDHQLIFYGVCRECRKKLDKRKDK